MAITGKTFAAAALAIGMIFATAPSASAGGYSKRCPSESVCRVEGNNFPGGTLSIDADVIGGPNTRVRIRYKGDNGERCVAEFWVNDPPRSWVCHNAHPGHYRVLVDAPERHDALVVGARW
ncbi:hypothetical protein NLX83_06130 [Allokutzneria sp. A3M-2-11 16]|uniref:hypothetical protein n=1 Tax=Allokutzneria sp. A3M-2-11 16 TaxID=2962043 RepID=UPI0020B70682|nr:hypothetical protein [Allokutzneria sp. A3M-2-11 16]MCP3798830.1 hypothetical protein [Allokutzneria sp. A3M-2-11 16]